MRGLGLFAMVLAGALVAGCQGDKDEETAPAPTSGSPAASTPAASGGEGATLFAQHCQGCHGDKGQGASGPNIAQEADEEREELVKVILNGEGKMPAFKGKLTEAQVDSVIAHLRTFAHSDDARPVH